MKSGKSKRQNGSNGRKRSDPEEIERMKFRAMCRFRALGRLAMENAGWMLEETLPIDIIQEVRMSIMQTFQERTKKKKILSLDDKILLCQPFSRRDEADKNYLYRIIGGLKCFRDYPKRVRRCLAAVSFFKYYGPGRVIIREGHPPNAMYFVLNGELRQTKKTYDILKDSWVDADAGKLITGDVFGHESLLHNIPRLKTCTTLSACELLCVMKEDFREVLQSTIQSQWDEVQSAMSRFTYFSTFSEIAIREGCMLAKMKSYKPDETILGDGKGVPNFVYFILSGQCKMIESLVVSVKKQGRKTFYSLYVPKDTITVENVALHVTKIDETKNETTLKESENDKQKDNIDTSDDGNKNQAGADISMLGNVEDEREDTIQVSNVNEEEESFITRVSEDVDNVSANKDMELKEQTIFSLRSSKQVNKEFDMASNMSVRSSRKSMISSKSSTADISHKISNVRCFENLPKNVKVFFMQVCLMNAGGCFGLGETMKNRRIIAVGEVNCLLLPKHWLWQWNPANIWSRIKHFLDRKIPSTEKVFAEFELNQRWNNYKDCIIKEVFAGKKAVNPTSVHDVPYSIRIDQNFDFGECIEKKSKIKQKK